MCPNFGSHGMASCAPQINVFDIFIQQNLIRIFCWSFFFLFVYSILSDFVTISVLILVGLCSGYFYFIYFFGNFSIRFYLFSSISVLFLFVFFFIYVPYSGTHGMSSCAPRLRVFKTICQF